MEYPFLLSVLIPCYNVEEYLDQSLWCLEQQWDDDKSMEIVFVNDGSTDGTMAKLQSFCRKHPDNTILIDKEVNGGVAQARNDALRVARGRWISFFDPDDALSSGALQAMCNDYLDDGVDILSFGANSVLNADILPLPHYKGRIVWEGNSKDFYKAFSTKVPWMFIYSHKLLDRLNVNFRDFSLLEGELFNMDVFLNDGIRVRRVDCKPYYFNIRPASLSSIGPVELNTQKVDEIMGALEYMEHQKHAQDDKLVVDSIARKQTDIARLLMPIFVRGDQVNVETVGRIRRQLLSWKCYPYKMITLNLKYVLYDLMFRFPSCFRAFRPLVSNIAN